MKIRHYLGFFCLFSLFIFILYFLLKSVNAYPDITIPTISVPTVTGTATGPLITVRPGQNENSINVRSGPNVLFQNWCFISWSNG